MPMVSTEAGWREPRCLQASGFTPAIAWVRLGDPLYGTDRRVVHPDYRGIGGITRPGRTDVDAEDQGEEGWRTVACKLNTPITPDRSTNQ